MSDKTAVLFIPSDRHRGEDWDMSMAVWDMNNYTWEQLLGHTQSYGPTELLGLWITIDATMLAWQLKINIDKHKLYET